jgi:regulatory protein
VTVDRRRESAVERRARRAEVDDPEIVLAAALHYLEIRARSVAETRRRLTEAGYQTELVEGAIEQLTGLGLLDDEAFARQWVESRDRARPRGETALKRELRLRGVDATVVDAVLESRRGGWAPPRLREPAEGGLDEVAGPGEALDPEEAAARRLLERRRRDLDRIDDPRKRRQRAWALLARYGFAPDVASRVAATVVAARDREPDEAG